VLIDTIILEDDKMKKLAELQTIHMYQLSTEELLTLQSLKNLKYNIQCWKDDLMEYHSHSAHHKSEDEWAKKELEELKDDEAIIMTAEFKMKILSCLFF
jgi:hypothetical protein